MEGRCPFCSLEPAKYLAENEHFVAVRDIRPVSRGHTLVVSRRHITDFFALSGEEMASLREICQQVKLMLEGELGPDGYNLGMNCGRAAGQSVFHFHLHFIPRYSGDRGRLGGLREYLRGII
jgi:diadenosine tetraphosphate (Ap4A) HIT family hydrolase